MATALIHAAGDPPRLSLAGRARVWWTILRICIEERLVYRGDFVLGALMRFMPIVTQVFLWGAVFAAARTQEIRGWTENKIIAYYLLTMISRAFSSMPGLASTIAAQVRSGEIKKYLIQPVDMIGFLLLSRVAHKLVYYIVATLPFALIFYICRDYFARRSSPRPRERSRSAAGPTCRRSPRFSPRCSWPFCWVSSSKPRSA